MALLLSLLLLQQAASPGPPAAIREATLAVERDSAVVARRRWEDALRADPEARYARLALGTLLRLTYSHDEARNAYQALIAAKQDLYSVHARLGLAELMRMLGPLDSAAIEFRQARDEGRALGDRPAEVDALIGLALVLRRTEPATSALAVFAEAERLLPPGEPALEARLRCGRAPLLVTTGKPRAREEADAGLALARTTGEDRLIGRCWQALGSWTFVNIDDPAASGPPFDSAETYLRRARDLAGVAEALAWSGYDHFSFFDHGTALADLQEAGTLGRRSGHRYAEAWAHRLIGSVEWRTGSFSTASQSLSTADALARSLGDRLELMHIGRMRGNVAFALARIDEAEQSFREALAGGEQLGDLVVQMTALHGLAWVQGARGNWADAEQQYWQTIAFMKRNSLEGMIPGMRYSGSVLALRNGKLHQAEAGFRWYLRTSSPTEYAGRYQSRSRLAEIQWRRGHLDSAVAELSRASDHLDSLRGALSDEGLRTLAFQTSGGKFEEPDYGFARLIAGFVQGGRVDAAFRLAEHRRARDLSDRLLRATASDSSRSANLPAWGAATGPARAPDESTAVLEYVAGRWGQPTTVFTLVGDRLTAHILPSMDSIGPRVERFVAVTESGGDAERIGEHLRRALLDSALTRLPPGISRLVIVADDVLHRLPFDALPYEGKPLITRYAIAFAPSAAIANALGSHAPRSGSTSMLVMGNPSTVDLPPLPFAEVEARSVGRFALDPDVRLGAMASERYLKSRQLAGIGILHFASHAIVDDGNADRTALALSPDGDDDGFLSPGEILGLSLPADLIVLSACRSAAGPVVRGEGVQGLTAPLLAAGARSIVATLWSVRDEAALGVVRGLYEGLAAGMPVAEALRAAKLHAIRRGAAPRDWAAFTVVGNPMVQVELQRPRKPTTWWGISVVVVLVTGLAGVWLARRRTTG